MCVGCLYLFWANTHSQCERRQRRGLSSHAAFRREMFSIQSLWRGHVGSSSMPGEKERESSYNRGWGVLWVGVGTHTDTHRDTQRHTHVELRGPTGFIRGVNKPKLASLCCLHFSRGGEKKRRQVKMEGGWRSEVRALTLNYDFKEEKLQLQLSVSAW